MKSNSELISYSDLRVVIGLLGIVLPLLLLTGVALFSNCTDVVFPSVSSYYHSISGGIFVGVLFSVSICLVTYRGYDNDYIFFRIAAVAAMAVALFPTSKTGLLIDCTLNCNRPTISDAISNVHYVGAITFFVVLAYISYFRFTKSSTSSANFVHEKVLRNRVYRTSGVIMIVCILVLAFYTFFINDNSPIKNIDFVFWMEWIMLIAFGVSWITKGQLILKDK